MSARTGLTSGIRDANGARLQRVPVLDLDPSLAEAVPAERRELAHSALPVGVMDLEAGRWEAPSLDHDKSFGFLLSSGIMMREVRMDGSRSLEPLGPGDLARPWQDDAASFVEAELSVLTPTRVGVLDREFALRAARFPELIAALMERATRRARYLAVFAAIDGMVGVKKRLVALMWTLAERWGALRDGDIFVPIELRHSTLAHLVAARRPSVTSAIGELQREGTLERVEGGWVLRGEPPAKAS